jgi:hypothetical protein
MSVLCIPIPDLHRHRNVELEVTVDGVRRVMTYRVETVPWPGDEDPEARIERLRAYLRTHTADWDLVQIGPPDGDRVPVTFRQAVLGDATLPPS